MSRLNLNKVSSFVPEILSSPQMQIVLIPSKIKNTHLHEILPKNKHRPISYVNSDFGGEYIFDNKSGNIIDFEKSINIHKFPIWSLKLIDQKLLKYNNSKMLTTETVLPFPTIEEPVITFLQNGNEIKMQLQTNNNMNSKRLKVECHSNNLDMKQMLKMFQELCKKDNNIGIII